MVLRYESRSVLQHINIFQAWEFTVLMWRRERDGLFWKFSWCETQNTTAERIHVHGFYAGRCFRFDCDVTFTWVSSPERWQTPLEPDKTSFPNQKHCLFAQILRRSFFFNFRRKILTFSGKHKESSLRPVFVLVLFTSLSQTYIQIHLIFNTHSVYNIRKQVTVRTDHSCKLYNAFSTLNTPQTDRMNASQNPIWSV